MRSENGNHIHIHICRRLGKTAYFTHVSYLKPRESRPPGYRREALKTWEGTQLHHTREVLDTGQCSTEVQNVPRTPFCFADNLFSLLQVIVWGDYGRMDRKVFMGVVQILLDELDLSNLVIGWYKLFSTSSMCDPPLPSSSSPLGGSPKKSPGPSPRSSTNQGVASPMRGASPLPTIIPPPGHMHNMDEEGDYV